MYIYVYIVVYWFNIDLKGNTILSRKKLCQYLNNSKSFLIRFQLEFHSNDHVISNVTSGITSHVFTSKCRYL